MNQLVTFTEEQFAVLMGEREKSQQQAERALALAEELHTQNMSIMAGLTHFTKDQVASMFNCSVRQLERYAKDGKLVPVQLFGKPVYSAKTLFDFIGQHNHPEQETIAELINSRTSSFTSRHRRRISSSPIAVAAQ